jgi:hypothetical protein
MHRALQLLVLVLLLVLVPQGRAQTFVEGDYQINRKKATAGFEVAELLAGSNITITWNDATKTATLATGTGSTSITTLGTITTGTWNATPLATAFIANEAVTFAKMQHISTAHLLGRHSSGSGDVQQIGIDGGLELQGANLRRAALTGDVTASAGSNSTTIANDAVTYAKLQNVSAASRLIGRGSASGSGDAQEITLGTGLSMSGTTLNSSGISDGDTLAAGLTFPYSGIRIVDEDDPFVSAFELTGSNTDGRSFVVNLNDAQRTIDLFGNLTVTASATISGTNTGDQTTITGNSGTTTAALGLKTATGTVALSTATAPSSGQVLTATSGTAANWQTPAATGVTSVTGTGTVNGLALTGTVTSTGNLTLGGTLSGVNLATQITGTLGVANGGTGATTLTANNVLLGNGTSAPQTVAPGTTGNVLTSNGTTWTSTAPATTNPAGSGSELQFRSDATTFGAATNSSVSGGAITLGAAEALGTTSTARLTLANTTAAAAGAQQVSPSIVLEGQGWKTAASQTVRFRQNVLPVQGTTNPSATWRLQSEINNSGTWADTISVESGGSLRVIAGTTSNQSLRGPTVGLYDSGASAMGFCVGTTLMMYYTSSSLVLNGTGHTFSINTDLILGRAAAAQLQLGANTAVNSATAIAQTIKGPNATGTTSTGGSLTLAGGTGTTAGGAVILATSATTGAPVAAVTVNNNAVTTFAKPPVLPAYTVATLPATAANGMVQGAHAIVTDATAPTYLGALTGGGAVVCPVFYDGTAWVSH